MNEASKGVSSPLIVVFWAVGRKRPPLCRGCAPATPPYKNMPHRQCAFFATCRLASMAAAAHQLRHQEPEWFQGWLAGQLLWLSSYDQSRMFGLSFAVSKLLNIIAAPFHVPAVVLYYFDLRVRNEKYDFEVPR